VISATIAHAAAFAAIHTAAFPPGEAWGVPAFAELLATPGVHGLIEPAGGIILARHVTDEAEILTLATLPEARRQGIAARLLYTALQHAATHGVGRMFLEVSASNLAARDLYDSAGFVACGRRSRYYPDGSDAVVLQRSLSPA
jgi:ribosomal-protein-alanine N-acetyltransferase